ncbi:MAG: hypothetical protein U1E86_28390 [Burkholderiaceae bacterium]
MLPSRPRARASSARSSATSGQTGWKRVKATVKRDLGLSQGQSRTFGGVHQYRGVAISNAVLFLVLLAAGHPMLYLLWVVAWMTTFQLVTRIRAIAEHAMARPTRPIRCATRARRRPAGGSAP